MRVVIGSVALSVAAVLEGPIEVLVGRVWSEPEPQDVLSEVDSSNFILLSQGPNIHLSINKMQFYATYPRSFTRFNPGCILDI